MNIVEGSNIREMKTAEFESRIKGYKALAIDIGTGEGEFVYRQAKRNPDMMYIGIDASPCSMQHYAAKSARKREKGGLGNVLYVVGNAEYMPDLLMGKADSIFVHLPWGSLRDGIIKGDQDVWSSIKKVAKPDAGVEIYISYSELLEKREIVSRQLPELSLSYLNNVLKHKLGCYGIPIVQTLALNNHDLRQLGTKWAKKLGYGKTRTAYYIKCVIR